MLHQLTGVIARHQGDIRSVSIIEEHPADTRVYFELDLPGSEVALIRELGTLPVVRSVAAVSRCKKTASGSLLWAEALR